jgi:hypothetical protein
MSDNISSEQSEILVKIKGVVNALIEDISYPSELYPCDVDQIFEDLNKHMVTMNRLRIQLLIQIVEEENDQ